MRGHAPGFTYRARTLYCQTGWMGNPPVRLLMQHVPLLVSEQGGGGMIVFWIVW